MIDAPVRKSPPRRPIPKSQRLPLFKFQNRPTISRNRAANRAQSVGADAGVVAAGEAAAGVSPRTRVSPRRPPKATPLRPRNPSAEIASEIQAAAAPVRAPRGDRAPAPFVLPGESLSKYGATPVSDAHKSESFETPKPAQPVSTFKPASLIQSPIEWDGSGLLPGESISKHRSRQQEPEVENPAALLHTTLDSEAVSADAIEEEQLVEDMTVPVETTPLEPGIAQSLGDSAAIPEEDDVLEETFELASGSPEPSEAISSKHSDELVETATVEGEDSSNPAHVGPSNSETAEDDSTEDDGNRTASHNVDPFSPAGFRLFGLGGKKKKSEDEPPPIQPVPPAEPKAASVPSVSAFAPGSGLVEEEVIEGDEYDASASSSQD